MSWYRENGDRKIFGVPAVLTSLEAAALLQDLRELWSVCYGQSPKSLDADFAMCKRYFDPVARGQTLRNHLAGLGPLPMATARRLAIYGEPLIVAVSSNTLIAGVECRLMIDILDELDQAGDYVISREIAARAEHLAMDAYREWGTNRLRQVISLRSGAGGEVMQAVAVGLVLALLINRSDSAERAVVRWDSITPDGQDVDQALYMAAERFADLISNRSGRTQSDKRLKGGYGLTEARRRLAHRLQVIPDPETHGSRIFIPRRYRDEVVAFLGHDLARRSSLSRERLEEGFDRLVVTFRSSARALAYRSMIFELASETDQLKSDLLRDFEASRDNPSA